MARRKRLNRRLVIIILVVVGVLIVGVGAGLWRFQDRIFPKDPVAHARRGRQAFEQGDYRRAERNLHIAIRASKGENAKYLYDLGRVYLEWINKDDSLSQAEKRDYYTKGREWLRRATQVNREYVEPRRILCDMFWGYGVGTGQWNQFVTEATELLKLVPDDHQLYYKRAAARDRMVHETRDAQTLQQALGDYRKAIDLAKENIDYWLRWIALLEWTEAFQASDAGLKGFQEALKANPNSARLRIIYAQYLLRKERVTDAIKELKEAIEREPNSPEGRIAMARYLLGEGEYDQALVQLDAAEKVNPTFSAIYGLKTAIYRYKKMLDKAAEMLLKGLRKIQERQAQASDTQPSRKRWRLRMANLQLNYLLANVRLDQLAVTRETDKRASLLKEAKKHLAALSDLLEESFYRAKTAGRIALVENNLVEATRLLEIAYKASFQRAEQDAQIAELLFKIYQARGMPGKGENILRGLLSLPRLERNPLLLLALAKLKIRYRDFEAAQNLVVRAIRADEGNQEAKQLREELRILTGDKKVALGQKLSPSTVRIRLERADSLWNEDRDQGLAMVQELHQAMPQNLPVAETLINMNLLLGRTDRAKTVLEKMVTAHPDNENLKFQRQLFDASPERRVKMRLEQVDKIADPLRRALTRARIHGQVGNREEYVRSLEEAAKINPDAPVVIQMQFRNALARKDWELVRTAVARAKTGDENYGRILEAQALLAQNKYHQTVDVLTPARKEYPDSKIILRLLGRAYLFLKDIDQAAEVYGVLESNDPGDFDALKGLAVVAEMRGEKERNERFVVRAYRNPAGKRDHYIRMRHLEIEEKYAKGDEIRKIIDERERLLKQRPNNLDNVEHLAGMYELRTKEFDKSEKMYRYGFEKSGQSLRWARALAFFYARIGQSTKGDTLLQNGVRQTKDKAQKVSWLVLQGDYLMLYDAKQAYNAYSQAISTDPSNPIGHRALAGMHERQGNWSKAAVAMVNYLAIAREDTRGQKTLIRYLIYAGEYDKAGKEIAAILDKTPADAKTLMLKGALHVARGEAGKALPPLSQALEKNRNYVSALIIRSRAYHILGEMGRARADLERARGQSNAPDVVMELVNLYVRLDDLDSAQLSLQGIMSRIPTYQPAVRRLINLCIMRKKWPKMERELRKAKKLFPKEPYYWLTEAEMWRQRNRLDKAIGALGKAFALVPGSPDVLREYLLGLAIAKQYDTLLTVSKPYETRPGWGEWIKALRARAMAGKGRTEDAEDLFILAVTHARTRELGFIVNQIRATYGTGPAVAKLEAWARRRPGDWLMQVLLGDLYIRVANVPEGSLSPEQVKVYRAKAISAYQAALGMAKGTNQTGPINYRLGSAYHLDGKYSQAEQAYLACLKVSPDNYGALNDLAYLYVNETDQPDKGLPYAQKVVKFRPRDATILDTYGWVLAKMEKYDQASKVLEQSIEREPAMPASRYHLGWVHEQTGRMREAKKQYRLGIELVSQKKGDRLYKVLQKAWKRVGGK